MFDYWRLSGVCHVGRQDVTGSEQILPIDHLRDRVNVTGSDGDADGTRAGCGLLGRRAVLAACGKDGALVWDLVLLRQIFNLLSELVVGDERAVFDVKPKALALAGDGLFGRDAGSVAGEGDVDAEADIRLDGVAGGLCAAETDFLLHGECNDDFAAVAIVLLVERADALDAEPAGNAVVQGLADNLVADLDQRFVHNDEVADSELLLDLLGGHADIDKELFDFGDLLAVFGATDVDRTTAGVHHALEVAVLRDDQHSAAEEVAGVKSAGCVHPKESLVIDSGDVETDLIHVAELHDLQGCAALVEFLYLFSGARQATTDEVAHRVGFDAIEETVDFFLDQIADSLFASGDAGSFAETLEQIGVFQGKGSVSGF